MTYQNYKNICVDILQNTIYNEDPEINKLINIKRKDAYDRYE